MTQLQKTENFQTAHFDEKQIDLIKNSICKGASNEELQFFIYACQRTGLDPFAKQIYSVPRGGQRTIQTSVDGFRLIADRSGRYSPGREPTFTYDKQGNLESATAYVMKQTKDGTWHEVSANAHYNEYNAGSPLWKKMPRAMLSKCAECLALRKAFPAEMSGLYGQEEMDQADAKPDHVKPLYIAEAVQTISVGQAIELNEILKGCSNEAVEKFNGFMKNHLKIDMIDDLPMNQYDMVKTRLAQYHKENQAALLEKEMANRPAVSEERGLFE
jgi:phage recombination protein Bet